MGDRETPLAGDSPRYSRARKDQALRGEAGGTGTGRESGVFGGSFWQGRSEPPGSTGKTCSVPELGAWMASLAPTRVWRSWGGPILGKKHPRKGNPREKHPECGRCMPEIRQEISWGFGSKDGTEGLGMAKAEPGQGTGDLPSSPHQQTNTSGHKNRESWVSAGRSDAAAGPPQLGICLSPHRMQERHNRAMLLWEEPGTLSAPGELRVTAPGWDPMAVVPNPQTPTQRGSAPSDPVLGRASVSPGRERCFRCPVLVSLPDGLGTTCAAVFGMGFG